MNDFSIVEDVLSLDILLFDVDFVNANNIGKLAKRSVEKNENTVRLLRYNNQICYLNNIKAVFH